MSDNTEGRAMAAADNLSIADEYHCPDCGYSLRGLTSERCPECGLVLDFIDASTSAIPWADAKRRVIVAAYFKTVFAVLFRSRVVCREVFRPVSYAAAQRFRWATIAFVLLATVAFAALETARWITTSAPDSAPTTMTFGPPTSTPDALLREIVSEFGLVAPLALLVGLVLALIGVTGVPSYLFHPRHLSVELQNRAVALSYYACAPLALIPAVIVVMSVLQYGIYRDAPSIEPPAITLAVAAGLGFFLYWRLLFEFAGRTLFRSFDAWRVAILTPLLWAAVVGLGLAVVPLLIVYTWLIVGSFLR